MYGIHWEMYPADEGGKADLEAVNVSTWREAKVIISMLECLDLAYTLHYEPMLTSLPGEKSQ